MEKEQNELEMEDERKAEMKRRAMNRQSKAEVQVQATGRDDVLYHSSVML